MIVINRFLFNRFLFSILIINWLFVNSTHQWHGMQFPSPLYISLCFSHCPKLFFGCWRGLERKIWECKWTLKNSYRKINNDVSSRIESKKKNNKLSKSYAEKTLGEKNVWVRRNLKWKSWGIRSFEDSRKTEAREHRTKCIVGTSKGEIRGTSKMTLKKKNLGNIDREQHGSPIDRREVVGLK